MRFVFLFCLLSAKAWGDDCHARLESEIGAQSPLAALNDFETPRLRIKFNLEKIPQAEVYTKSGEMIGTIKVLERENGVYSLPLSEFKVQGMGYATEAKYHIIERLFDAGSTEIRDIILEGNLESIALHKKLSFEIYDEDSYDWRLSRASFYSLKSRLDNDPKFRETFFTARSLKK